jgi:hypothetical protein
LSVSKENVFAYVSDIQNLTEWATGFARKHKIVDGKHKLITPAGEIFFRIEADPKSGVVDMFGGPSEDRMACYPARVVALPGEASAFLFTLFQWPGLSDGAFRSQCESLSCELENVRRRLAAA